MADGRLSASVNARATLAQGLWLAAGIPAHVRYRRALRDPEAAQTEWLRRHLDRHANSAYGRALRLHEVRSYAEFVQRVPVVSYDDLTDWVARIRRGENNVLTCDPVLRLLPTSGSTGGRKLIPFTRGLQREFNSALGPWLLDLARQEPGLACGPAYWSVTPMGAEPDSEPSAVPIGFEDDARYLGVARAWLVRSAMAVPASVRHLRETDRFRETVLGHLLACADLRLISVWHPSFLLLLLDTLEAKWPQLLERLPPHTTAVRRRALAHGDPKRPETLWPEVRVISAWADALAAGPAAEVQRRWPGIRFQSKGLLATEGVVTVPLAGAHPLALTSHLFEFRDDAGRVQPATDLEPGQIYDVIFTTGGGLWRYELGDRVEVTGRVERTPSLRFLGRGGSTSDCCGEKLSDAFVAGVLGALLPHARFVLLAPETLGSSWRYVLFADDASAPAELAARLDARLHQNPHYALCRRLGQLAPPVSVRVNGDAFARFAAAETARGRRLGDLKPAALSPRLDWRTHLEVASGSADTASTPAETRSSPR